MKSDSEHVKRSQFRLAMVRLAMRDIADAQRKHGLFVAPYSVAVMFGVSRARVGQLIDSGKIAAVFVMGKRYVSFNSLVIYCQQEPKVGRPVKLKSVSRQ